MNITVPLLTICTRDGIIISTVKRLTVCRLTIPANGGDQLKKIENKKIVGTIENVHLLRKLFIKRTTSSSPLHFGQVAIMRMIGMNENCTQTMLAERLNVTPASVATSTKRLQRAGLITKTVDKNNLRCKRLSLTEKGRETIEQHHKLFEDYDQLIFSSFNDEDKQQFLEYLERLVTEMKKVEGIDLNCENPMELSCLLRRSMEEYSPASGSKND